ncbi:MAG TPA: hypothetical protein VJN96_12975 [Vicinamibacterales bacterium]|nr:hypothetical protein [Vicinamibacterales bacterium]
MKLWNLFGVRGRKPVVDRWRNRRLTRACDRHTCATAAFAALEQQRQVAAAKAPTDYDAALALDALMPKLAQADDEVTAAARAVTLENEVEQIVNDLLPTFVTLRGQLDRWYEQFAERADVPDDEAEWVPFNLAAIELERLRWTIQQAVGEDAEVLDVSRGFDYVRGIRDHWDSVAKDRERLFTMHGPGHKIRFGRPAWFPLADRLAKLRAGGIRPKEAAYAVR